MQFFTSTPKSFFFLKRAFILVFFSFLLNGCAKEIHPPQESEKRPPLIFEKTLQEPAKPLLPPIFRVALLLPLTGENQSLGEALSKGTELGFFEHSASTPLEIFPLNVNGADKDKNKENALKMLSKLLEETEIDLIIGPLMADDVASITPLAWEKAIPVLSFSNMSQVAGDNVFIMGFSPEEQIKKAMEFALSQNITQFVVIAPLGEYGRLVTKAARQGLYSSATAKIKEVIYYDPSGSDLEEKLKSLNLTNVQALLIPEGGTRLLKILEILNQDLSYQTLRPRLIGSGQWDDPALFQNTLLQGAWFASTRSPRWEQFAETYQRTYHSEPPRLASLGFDAITLASEAASTPQTSVALFLTRSEGFEGVEGKFSFTPQGVILRDWHIFEIDSRMPTFLKRLN